METLNAHDLVEIFALLKAAAEKNKDYYIELDSAMGDGDLGLTMAASFSAAYEAVRDGSEADVGMLCAKAGMAMAKAAPSTMGTLMATGFMKGGKAVKGAASMDARVSAAFWKAFVEGVMERGKSKPGEKTIIDAIYPAALSFEMAAAGAKTLASAYAAAKDAALKGLEATKDMVAQHGRAAYYQEKSKTKQDPGATVGCMLVSVFADYAAGSGAAGHAGLQRSFQT